MRLIAGDDNADVLTETFRSGLHGLLTLMRNGRLRRPDQQKRLALLISRCSH